MKVNFSKPLKVEIKEIESFFQSIDCDVSESTKQFFLKLNGATPETNIFDISENNQSGINELIPISKIKQEQEYLDHIGDKVFPIAIAEGGNYLIVDFSKGNEVYFWDHEEPSNTTLVATDLDELLSKLEPFDPSNIKLLNGKVESAWIDPDFLKKMS